MKWAEGYIRYPQVPLRRVFAEIDRGAAAADEIVTAYTDGSVTLRSNVRLDGYHEATDTSSYKGVRIGDLVVHGLDILRGSVGVSDSDGAISPVCSTLLPRTYADPRYFAYVIRAQAWSGLTRAMARGIREGGADFRRWDTLAELPLPLPTPNEQKAIADLLDAETARIDALIAKKRTTLELLGERRLALSLSAMEGSWIAGDRRPTPVPWLTAMPTNWSNVSVRSIYDVQLGLMLNEDRTSGEHLRPYMRNANVGWGSLDLSDVAYMNFPPEIRERYRLRDGDLLVCEGGAGVAESSVWRGEIPECYYQKSLHRVRSRGQYPVAWLAEWLRLWKSVGAHEAEGNLATIPHLTAEQLKSHSIPLPPVAECRAIVERVHREARSIGVGQALISEQVTLLNERRRALITAAVTGQIAVPGVEAV